MSQRVHPIHSMFGSRLGFSGSADQMALFAVRSNPRWRLTAILDIQNGHNIATGLPIDVMFGSKIGFLGPVDTIVQRSITLSDPEPQFQGHTIA